MNKAHYLKIMLNKSIRGQHYINDIINPKRILPLWQVAKLNEIKHCQRCKKTLKELGIRKFERHHVIPLRYGGVNDISNIIILCRECHKIADQEATKKYGENNNEL